MIKASVIIPTKNPGVIFTRVLEKVLSQKFDWEYEVLVIDSGSTDSTIDFVKNKSCQFKNLRLHQIPSTEFGHGKTRNLGISMTQGEFAVLITHDALPADDHWLSEMIKAIDLDPEIAGAFGKHLPYPDCNPILKHELTEHFNGLSKFPRLAIGDDLKRYEEDEGWRQLLHFFSDNNAVVRRSVWEKIPYPDVNFAEDQAWAKKIIEAGYVKTYAPLGTVYHSHNYSVKETFRRAFDESRALHQLFGYVMVKSGKALIKHPIKKTYHDFRFLKERGLLFKNLLFALKLPFYNIAKIAGLYLGSKNISDAAFQKISLDDSLRRGKR